MSETISQPTGQKVNLVTEVPGERSKSLREKEDALLAPGLQGFALKAGIVVKEARGSAVTDLDGNTFLDVIGGIGVNGLGHSHPKFVQAIQSQVAKASVGSFSSESRLELLERLCAHAPAPNLTRPQFYSGGSEAVESALRLAKNFTGNFEFISFDGGFHGKTMGTLSLMGSSFKDTYGPFVPGSHILPYPNPYRPPSGSTQENCADFCIDYLRKYIKEKTSKKIAAIIVEPMQGTAGNIIPPKEFLPELKNIAQENGALLIADEMITGFGRTGTYWGCEHSGVTPDIVTLGKQFGGGYPLSALLGREDIVQAKPWSNPSGSSSSYGGNPLAMAAAAASLKIIDEEGLVENSKVVGEYFLSKLKPFEQRYPFVGEVRGLGLLLGIELVEDKKTKKPLSRSVTEQFFLECLKRGLLTMSYAASFRIQPSMTIDCETVDSVVDILQETFDYIAEKRIWKN